MSAAAGAAAALVLGLGLGLQYNPLAATLASVAAAVLYGYPGAPSGRRPLAVSVLALGWLAGDGARIGRALAETAPASGARWAAVLAWVVTGAAVGYVVPAAAGILVGRRVTRGTGWLSAGAVALTVSGALSVLAPIIADRIAVLA